MNLEQFFKRHPKVAVACSGGVDSTFLLSQAVKYADCVKAYFVKSAFQPDFELADAREVCTQLGAELVVLTVDVLQDKVITMNPSNRCYYCKKRFFGSIREAAQQDGFPVLLDGTNASDDVGDRPGMKALEEFEVLSPLRICSITKDMLREQAREEGLAVHSKPAYSCLATRIPCGTAITLELLNQIEESEKVLFDHGFKDFRVRVFHGGARIQIKEQDMLRLVEQRAEMIEKLHRFFSEIFLDMIVTR